MEWGLALESFKKTWGPTGTQVVDATATEKLQLNDNRCEADVTLETWRGSGCPRKLVNAW